VLLDGEDISALPAPLRTRRGLGRAFQLTQLFARLTVLENVRLAVQARRQRGIDLWRIWLDHREWIDEAMALLERVQLASQRDALAAELPHGDQRKLEVALLIALDPKVYLFDEPTAGMSKSETRRFVELIRDVTKGRTLLTVEHDMGVVFGLADKIAVLVYGEVIAFDKPEVVRANARVQEAYLGSVLADQQAAAAGH
jgi:branched-chain amino acid transport system ATP-binding protein